MTALATRNAAPLPPERKLLLEMEAVRTLLKDVAALADDDALRLDAIEGETGFNEAVAQVLLSIDEDEIILAGIKARKVDLNTREARFKARMERKRALIERAMMDAEINTLQLPLATLSLVRRAPGVVVTDEAAIPSEYFVQPPAPPPALDTRALAARLRERAAAVEAAHALPSPEERLAALEAAGRRHPPIPGATLDNGSASLTVRPK